MKVTLRKANALQNSINEVLRHIDVKTKVSLNEFQDPEGLIAVAAAEAKTNLDRKVSLTNALYDIRAAVGFVNHTTGVDEKLTEVARIEKQIQLYSGLLGVETREAPAVITGKLDKLRNTEAKSRIYGYNDTVDTGVLTPDQIEGYKADMRGLKKEKQSINDRVLELNVRTEIELDADTVALLQAEQLV